jgi:hypothetical protein
MPVRQWLGLAALAALVSAGTTSLLDLRQARTLAAELSLRPPIAVIDTVSFIPGAPDGPADEAEPALTAERLAVGLRAATDRAERLAAAGYLVLESQAVARAPEDLHVRAP